jgi:hypothetical protein
MDIIGSRLSVESGRALASAVAGALAARFGEGAQLEGLSVRIPTSAIGPDGHVDAETLAAAMRDARGSVDA